MLLAGGGVNAKAAVLISIDAPTEAHIEPAAAYRVHGGGVLCETYGVVERGYEDSGSEPYLPGLSGHVAGYDERGRAHPVAREVVLGDPRAAETEVLGQPNLVRRVGEELGGVSALGPGDVGEQGVLHLSAFRFFASTSGWLSGGACTDSSKPLPAVNISSMSKPAFAR